MTQPEYFEDMYASSSDPWSLAERVYERRKYDVTMASLPRTNYRRAFEAGCSIGMLTARLVARCDEVIATDPVASPLVEAKRRAPDAVFVQGAIPAAWPQGTFDLIVLSELMYYLSAADRQSTIDQALASLEPGGHLAAVHWRHSFEAAVCTGDDVHRELMARPGWTVVVQHMEDDFRLEVFERAAI